MNSLIVRMDEDDKRGQYDCTYLAVISKSLEDIDQ